MQEKTSFSGVTKSQYKYRTHVLKYESTVDNGGKPFKSLSSVVENQLKMIKTEKQRSSNTSILDGKIKVISTKM